ncbi:MAG: peptide deformylase [Candidatus Omnitrophica bacterium]|nr:peptide deformylase [Candidatus Omnitrophota bacterium]
MQELTIKKFPDPVLRKKASKVFRITPQIKEALAEMAKLMYLSQGVGLAAPQVGIDKQLAVIDIGSGLINLINPVISKRDGTEILEEGCLSVPELAVKVKRSKSVTVQFLDTDGEARQIKADGLLARAIQHELDHLRGILIIDYVNPVKKILLTRSLTKRK